MIKLIRNFFYRSGILSNIKPQRLRDDWIKDVLKLLQPGLKLLDAGCGSQPYRSTCAHLDYFSQDFAQYSSDQNLSIEAPIASFKKPYRYGDIDYVCDITSIPVDDQSFDVILCTEVFEHLPSPEAALNEFSRLLKTGGILILTVPTFTIKHMDPYHFYTGFTDKWLDYFLAKYEMEIITCEPVLDYYKMIALEITRVISIQGFWAGIVMLPAFVYLYLLRPTEPSRRSLPYGYHVVAKKLVDVGSKGF